MTPSNTGGPSTDWRAVTGLFAAYGAVFFDRLAPLYLLALLADDLGVDPAGLGVLAAAIALGWVAAVLVSRRLGDVPLRERVVLAGAVSGLLGVLSAAAPTWAVFVALRGLAGLVAGTAAPAVTSMSFRLAPPSGRGRVMGVVQASTRILGSLVAPALVTAVAATAGWRPAIAVSGAVAVAGALALRALSRQVSASPAGSAAPLTYRPGGRRDLRVSAAAGAVFIGWVTVVAQSGVPLVRDWLALDPAAAGRVVGGFGAGSAVAALLVPPLSDRIGRALGLALPCLLGAAAGAAIALLAAADRPVPPVAAFLLVAGAGVALGAMPLVLSIIPAEAVATGEPGRAVVVPVLTAELAGGAVLPLVAAPLAATSSHAAVLGVASALVLLAGAAGRLLTRR